MSILVMTANPLFALALLMLCAANLVWLASLHGYRSTLREREAAAEQWLAILNRRYRDVLRREAALRWAEGGSW